MSGNAPAYDRHCEHLLAFRAPLETGMFSFDARLSEHHPTVEVRGDFVGRNGAPRSVGPSGSV